MPRARPVLQNWSRTSATSRRTRAVCDPVTLQIVRGALRAIQSEMEALIERTAMSPFIREKKDFYAALFDGDGRADRRLQPAGVRRRGRPDRRALPARRRCGQATSTGSTTATPPGAPCRTRPTRCSSRPVFADGKLSAFAQSWAHFNDIGGMRPGSLSPDCTDIFQEGIIVPPVRVARDGVMTRRAAAPVLPQLALSRDGEGRHARLDRGDPAGRAAAGRAVRPLRPRAHDWTRSPR